MPAGPKTMADVKASIGEDYYKYDCKAPNTTIHLESTRRPAQTWSDIQRETSSHPHASGPEFGQEQYSHGLEPSDCLGDARPAGNAWVPGSWGPGGVVQPPENKYVAPSDLAFPISFHTEVLAKAQARSRSPLSNSRFTEDRERVISAEASMDEMQESVRRTIMESEQVEAEYLHRGHPRDQVAVLPGHNHWAQALQHPVLGRESTHADELALEEELRVRDQQQMEAAWVPLQKSTASPTSRMDAAYDISRRDQDQIEAMLGRRAPAWS